MSSIFISYSRKDIEFARKVVDALAKHKLDTWIDWESIPKGEDFEQEIYRGIEGAESLVFLMSPDSATSEMCNKEIAHAKANNKRIVPIVIRDTDPSKFFLAESGKEIARRNWVFCRDQSKEFEQAISDTVKTIHVDYDWLRYHTKLQLKALDWERKDQENSFLIRGKELAEAERQFSTNSSKEPDPTNLQLSYVLKSKQEVDRQRRFTTRVALVTAILMAGLAIFGFVQANLAEERANIALARQLSAQAGAIVNSGDSKEMQAVLLAIQSMRLLPSLEAAQVLQNNTLAYRVPESLHPIPGTLAEAYSLDGRFVAFVVLGDVRVVHVRNLSTGQDVTQMETGGVVSHVAFSPDGQFIAAGGDDNQVYVWQASDGHQIASFRQDDASTSVTFSPDGQLVASGNADATVRIWEFRSGKEVAQLEHAGPLTSVKFSPDGHYLASASEDFTLQLWETTTWKEFAQLQHEGIVTSIAFSPDGKLILTGSADFRARIWRIATGEEITRVTHDATVTSVAFNPKGNLIATGSFDATARVWDASTGVEIARVTSDDAIASVAFSDDGKYVTSTTFGNVNDRVWRAVSGNDILQINAEESIYSAAFSPTGRYIAVGKGDYRAEVWDTTTNEKMSSMIHNFNVWSVAFSPDEKYVVSSGDNTARVWNIESGTLLSQVQHEVFTNIASFSPDGRYVLSAGCDQRSEIDSSCTYGSARIWDASTGQELSRMIHDSQVYDAAFSPDGKYVVSAGCDVRQNGFCIEGSARVWEAETGAEVSRMIHQNTVRVVAFSPDGRYVASGSDDETARVWNALTGKEIARMRHWAGPITDNTINLSPNQGTVRAIAFSPDGKYVVSAGCDQRDAITTVCTEGIARVWATTTGREVAFMRHGGQITSVAFSPDGKYVLSGGLDGTARVWEAKTGVEIARMAHGGLVLSVKFSPDGKYVISAGCTTPGPDNSCLEGSARRWIWRTEDLITNACSRVTRNLTRAEWDQYFQDAMKYQPICPDLPVEPAEGLLGRLMGFLSSVLR